jgi:hypothetical protein
MQARWGTHGDHPVIVVAPASVEEVYRETIRAFNLAEALRTPVIVLYDEIIAHLMETVALPGKGKVETVDRKWADGTEPGFMPYQPVDEVGPRSAWRRDDDHGSDDGNSAGGSGQYRHGSLIAKTNVEHGDRGPVGGLARGAGTDEFAHQEPQIVAADVDQVALGDVFAALQVARRMPPRSRLWANERSTISARSRIACFPISDLSRARLA